jgi:hypothetical protein
MVRSTVGWELRTRPISIEKIELIAREHFAFVASFVSNVKPNHHDQSITSALRPPCCGVTPISATMPQMEANLVFREHQSSLTQTILLRESVALKEQGRLRD